VPGVDPLAEAFLTRLVTGVDATSDETSTCRGEPLRPPPPARDPLTTSLTVIGLASAGGGLLGWLALPGLLAQAFRVLLDLPTQPADVSRLAIFLGILIGLLVGVIAGLAVRR
jgi:hypothetical protein